MSLNKEQKEAVEYLQGPLLVLAGPGTGKTQLLSAKVEYILRHEQTSAEHILCVTYTESGARNMRERLGTMIGVAANDVNIFTYHALGSYIIERYKGYATSFDRQLDQPIDGVKQYMFLKSIQAELPFNDILKTAKISDIVSIIGEAKSARLAPDDLAKVAEQNAIDGEQIAADFNPLLIERKSWPRKFEVRNEEVFQPMLAILAKHSDAKPIVGNVERLANTMLRELNDLIEIESQKDKPSVGPISDWIKKYFECADAVNWRMKDYVRNKKLISVAAIMKKYNSLLEAEGLFDFADMIEEAIRILKTDDGFRATLTEQFNYILLDEFQDTNPSQFEIIKLLTDYEKPIIMAVGDDDQAICEFQGADASNLLTFQNHYDAKVITLVENYRSIGRILDFSHHVAGQIAESFARKRSVNKKLHSMLDLFSAEKHETVPSKISRHEFANNNDEYYWVAERISDLIKSGVQPSEIAVIAPKHKLIAPILPYLKARDIDVAYERRENLLDEEKIHQLVTMAEFVNDLAEEKQPSHRLLEILSYDFWQLNSYDILEAVHQARGERKSTLSFLMDSDNEQLKQIAKFLADLALKSFDTPLERWLDLLMGREELNGYTSPYLKYYENILTKAELFEFYESLNSLRKTVLQHSGEPKLRLRDFVHTVHDYQEAGVSIMKVSSYQDADAAVQLLSVHKSKGLEFRYVFMVAVDNDAWGKGRGNQNQLVLPSNLRQIRHTGGTDDEKLRLLFVAITRAKDFLIMTNSRSNEKGEPVLRLKYLEEVRNEGSSEQVSPFLVGDESKIITHYDDFDVDTRIDTTQRAWTGVYQVLTPSLENLMKKRLEDYRLTATDLTSFIDLMYGGPDTIFQRRLMQAPDEPLSSQLAYGDLIHAVFEQVTKSGISNDDAVKIFEEKAAELPLTDTEIIELTEKGRYSLPIVLDKFGPILRDNASKAEVNLSSEHLHLGNVPLTGKLDHIAIDKDQKTIEVYDYKTSKFHDGKWDSHSTLYKYKLQLLFYKVLLNLSPTYRDYKVTTGHILFVSPDDEGRVYDKELDFTAEGDEEILDLVKVVYHEIVSLDFVTNPEINIVADLNKYQLADIKNFVAKLREIAQTLGDDK